MKCVKESMDKDDRETEISSDCYRKLRCNYKKITLCSLATAIKFQGKHAILIILRIEHVFDIAVSIYKRTYFFFCPILQSERSRELWVCKAGDCG